MLLISWLRKPLVLSKGYKMEKFVKGEELENPSRYLQNAIEAWDFAIQSLFPYPLGVVSKYVIRHKHKGGKQDLEKALIWARKASESYNYMLLNSPNGGISYFDLVPKVSEKNFPDLGSVELGILRDLQDITGNLKDEKYFNKDMTRVIESLEALIEGYKG